MHVLSKTVDDYISVKTTIKELEQRLKALEDEIKAHMGSEEELSVDGRVVRWKRVVQNRFDTAEFKKRHRALYEQFTKRGETRRFTVT